jgi:hypothetical protein
MKTIQQTSLALLGAILLLGVICTGCENKVTKYDSNLNVSYRVVKIEGCQYILVDRGVAHKGNCNNPIHSK